MAYHVETVHSNGYRCGCCSRSRKDSWWEDSIEEALSTLPTEFPTEGDFGGTTRVTIKELVPEKRKAKFDTVCSVRGKNVVEGEAEIMVPAR